MNEYLVEFLPADMRLRGVMMASRRRSTLLVALLAAMTVGWENVLDTEGNDIPFATEVARSLYVSYPVVREQVDVFVANRRNFLRASLES